MTHHDLADLHLDLCGNCGGVWYDAGQFTRLINDGRAEVDAVEKMEPAKLTAVEKPAKMACPIDSSVLHQGLFKGHQGITISTCYECAGIFIDANSLKQLDAIEDSPEGLAKQPVLTGEELAMAAQLDAQAVGDLYRSKLAWYSWGPGSIVSGPLGFL
jgi:Zn-finger nucleic acid-binding protein